MLVKFREKENHFIFFEKEYHDILPILEMVKQKATISLFLDPKGDERVMGRFYDYEYTIEINTGKVKESLLVILDCYETELNLNYFKRV
ncbi:hypothetical protein [Neobacillus niacini]|uniref:hypothetical protein n=1 Tax=Neobacillus niacini TaxID=86668 RepID=UPI00203E278E|nr:hypothetical protein [Neobacillus niacini]MCM3692186.1 hypothetical protein [Neobacillus niacini]